EFKALWLRKPVYGLDPSMDERGEFPALGLFPLLDLKLRKASIMGSATLCFSRWTQRRGRQLHRFQNCQKHGAWLLTEKALRCRRPVRPGEEKVVNGGEARPLARPIEAAQLMATQRQVA